jgi:hypothetical protein
MLNPKRSMRFIVLVTSDFEMIGTVAN